MKQLWNEGRVVGLSAYEIYVKETLAEDPDKEPASEREWLASTIANGSSVLIKWRTSVMPQAISVSKSDPEIVEFYLPENSRLCAANTLIASYFRGDAELIEGTRFAGKITDYGPLIPNNSIKHPATDSNVVSSETVPVWTDLETETNEQEVARMASYLNVVDGIAIQPGTWNKSDSGTPSVILAPNMSKAPVLRFLVNGPIRQEFWMLITGFTLRGVVSGVSGIDGADETHAPEDGDFLGPSVFPWASKIILTMPNEAVSTILKPEYERAIGNNASRYIDTTPVIDLEDVSWNYFNSHQDTRVSLTVTRFPYKGASVLTAYSRDNGMNPALYMSDVRYSGQDYLYPIDIVAPGTVKLFEAESTLDPVVNDADADKIANDFEIKTPENFSFVASNPDRQLYQRNPVTNHLIPIAANWVSDKNNILNLNIQSGTKKAKTVPLTDNDGNDLATDGSAGRIDCHKGITWDSLLESVSLNKTIDPLSQFLLDISNSYDSLDTTKTSDYVIHCSNDGGSSLSAHNESLIVKTELKDNTNNRLVFESSELQAKVPNYIVEHTLNDKITRTPSLNNSAGVPLSMNGTTAHIDGHTGFTWQDLMTALANNATIRPLTSRLNSFGDSLDDISASDTPYVIKKDISGNIDIVQYSGQLPNFMVSSVGLTPYNKEGSGLTKYLFNEIKLDIFTYQVSRTDGTLIGDVNTFANLLCVSGSNTLGVNGTDWYQMFEVSNNVDAATGISPKQALYNIYKRMKSSRFYNKDNPPKSFLFQSPGRTIVKTSTAIPTTYFFTVSALFDLTEWSSIDDMTQSSWGLIIGKMINGSGNPWGGSFVNSTNYQGALSFSELNCKTAWNNVGELNTSFV